MSGDLAVADGGLTVEFEGADECPDLTADEAEAVTGRIRRWVNDFPISDVVLAFRGRVWVALSYDSWAEWCECELGGLKLPAPKRREVVAELTGAGMSGEAIADALDVSSMTVSRDRALTNVRPENVTGKDNRTYTLPPPKPTAPQQHDAVIDAEIVCRDCDGFGCETCVPEDDHPAADVIDALADGDSELADKLTDVVNASPKPQPPRRRPITDQARDAGWELRKAVERIERLAADDRFNAQTEKVAPHLRGHLTDAITSCQAVLDRINSQLGE